MQYGEDATRKAEQEFREWNRSTSLSRSKIFQEMADTILREAISKKTTGRPIFGKHYGTSIMDDITPGGNMKKLFWTAVLYHKGKKTTLVMSPEVTLAESTEKAKVWAIKDIPASYKDRFDRLEVVVRPF